METKKLKIFELVSPEGREWVSGIANIDALHTYLSVLDMTFSDLPTNCELVELPEEKWEEYFITDLEDGSQISFKDYMETNTRPDIIAGTLYNDL